MQSRNIGKIFLLMVVISIPAIYSFAQSNQGVDLTFNASATSDYTGAGKLTLKSDGKIIIFKNNGNVFQSINGTPVSQIARLNSDGSRGFSFSSESYSFGFSNQT